MPTESQLNSVILEAALTGLQAERERLVEHIAEVERLLGHGARQAVAAPEEGTTRPRRHGMSAAGRRAIAEAQRKRWAAIHKASGQAPAKQRKAEAPRRKRKMSAAARKRIGDATRKRWAEYRKRK